MNVETMLRNEMIDLLVSYGYDRNDARELPNELLLDMCALLIDKCS